VIEDDLVLHYYGELGADDEARVSRHVGDCRECHAAYRRLQQVLMSVDDAAVGVPELPDGFERTVWARLGPALPRGRRGRLSPPRRAPRRARAGGPPLAFPWWFPRCTRGCVRPAPPQRRRWQPRPRRRLLARPRTRYAS